MTSEAGRTAAALGLAALAGACTGSTHDGSVADRPLVVIQGHVDRGALARVHPDSALLGALVWAAVPAVNPVCLQFDTPDLRAACPDPYGVFWGQVERAAPVGDDGTFALPLYNLPKASVSVGDEVTRIAYGSLVVLEDVDGDGEPTLPGDLRGRPGEPDEPPPPVFTQGDVVVAASFHTLMSAQQRVVLREGGFVAESNFYPAPGCDPPPPGFSILAAPPYSGQQPPYSGRCVSRDLEAPVEVSPIDPEQGFAFSCRAVQRGSRVFPPEGDARPPATFRTFCLGRDILGMFAPGSCPRLVVFALKGCQTDLLCPKPEWDISSAPPAWWPCS